MLCDGSVTDDDDDDVCVCFMVICVCVLWALSPEINLI